MTMQRIFSSFLLGLLFRASFSAVLMPLKTPSLPTSQPRRWKDTAAVAALGILVAASAFPNACRADDSISWRLGNGEVHLSSPLSLAGRRFYEPRLLGSGGGGAVFALRPESGDSEVAVKVSWLRSASSVENECRILQVLEEKRVPGVERCLAKERYQSDNRRVVIAMEPVMDDSFATVSKIRKELQPHAVQCIVRTMVQMLGANVVTTDVQPLISKATGDVLFIDMTEAKLIEQREPLPFLDLALAASFCVEMLSLIPEDLSEMASKALFEELRSVSLPSEIYDVISSQTQFMTEETIYFIDAKIRHN